MKNLRKKKDLRLVTTDIRKNYLVSEPSYQHLLAMEMKKKTEILMNKPVYLGLSILELSEILMYEFSYDYAKPNNDEKAKLCYMDTDSLIVYIKADDIYKDIAEDVETRFDT